MGLQRQTLQTSNSRSTSTQRKICWQRNVESCRLATPPSSGLRREIWGPRKAERYKHPPSTNVMHPAKTRLLWHRSAPPVHCSRICGPPKWIARTQTNPSHRACAWTGTLHRKQLRRLRPALLLGQRLIRTVCAENGLHGIFPLLGPHSGEECCCPYKGLRWRRSIFFEVCVLPQMFEVMSTRAAHR